MKSKSLGLFILILVLATLASLLIGWRLFFFQTKPPTTPSPIPTPTSPVFRPSPFPTAAPSSPPGRGDSPEDIMKSIQRKFPLYDFLPYWTENFQIDYVAPLTLEVQIKNDTPQTRQEALDWILSKGVNPSTHQIQWKVGL